jgi:hypothetical protein
MASKPDLRKDSQLIKIIQNKKLNEVQKLMEVEKILEKKEDEGLSRALLRACEEGLMDIVAALIRAGNFSLFLLTFY